MTKEQIERVETALLNTVEEFSKEATTAADVEALAAVARALVEVHQI